MFETLIRSGPYGLLVPFLCSAVAAGLIRWAGGRESGRTFAGGAVGFGFLACFLALLGPPRWALSGVTTVFWLASAAWIAGLLLDWRGAGRRAGAAIIVVTSAVAAWILLGMPLSAGVPVVIQGGAVAAGWGVVLWRLSRPSGEEQAPLVLLVVASFGLAGVTALSGAATIAWLANGLALALLGFALWNWPVPRFPFSRSALLAGGVAFLALAGRAWLVGKATEGALLALGLIFFVGPSAQRAARQIRVGPAAVRGALAPFVTAGLALVPVAAAWAIEYVALHLPAGR